MTDRPAKIVGFVPLETLRRGLVRLSYPPFDVCVGLVDGVPFAVDDCCNHSGASLSEGSLEEERLACPMHGYVFSIKSGELLMPKGLCENQRTFRARIEADRVLVEDEFELELR